ncbi:MAG: HesA/MoeB/ThiF family protein [Firmicutes bacterium]|jgi:adenylyltransferase/sulfurtransferase|uniref:Molybdopterin synthase sulfurylase n=1 Tax=Sulfobacillus benefaciens TaxID=453960 RepID=A0A2T2WQC6_9FIRM|nr:HesA/MoeB/ThiF family protein [Bacillota bacterium]MCL5013482.1 HesA/MoeB/ThiF family protein [Bacillota bacterium]PSR24441.1 MAG: molybdopterin synthase sulfurylase [Sulfobacillus benefaciens]
MVITEKERVRRLVSLPEAKPGWIRRLRQSRVAIVGIGGLGNASALYLAAQGVGHLTLIDPDEVEPHNLGRQILFGPPDVGRPKVEAACRTLRFIAPDISLAAEAAALTDEKQETLLAGHDVIVDGLDNWEARLILNRFSVHHRVPVVFAGAIGYEAQVYVVNGGKPCMQCLFGDDGFVEQSCALLGVLGPVAGMAGTVQAQEVLKLLLNTGDGLQGRIWTYDAFRNVSRVVGFTPRAQCPVCGGKEHEYGR